MSLASAGTATAARPIPALRSIGNRRVRMVLLLLAVSANSAGFARVSRDGVPTAIQPAKAPSCWPTNGGEKRDWACVTPPTRVTMPAAPALSMESIAILVKPSLQASQTTFIWMENHAKQTDLD